MDGQDMKTFIHFRRTPNFLGLFAVGAIAIFGFSSASSAINDEAPLVALGPAVISDATGTVKLSINGQDIVFDAATLTSTESGSTEAPGYDGVELLNSGQYVAVFGDNIEPGASLATDIIILEDTFVEGASKAYVQAIINDVTSAGYAFSDETTIDFTGTLYDGALQNLSAGDIVSVLGTSANGVIIATSGVIAANSSNDGSKDQRQPEKLLWL